MGYSAGVDGQPGGDTTFSAPDVTILFSAPGGQAGLAGTGVRLTSDLFSLSTVMLCNYVEISNSLGYVVGAGWQSVRVLNIGDMRTFPIFMIIEAGGVPAGEYTIHADAWSPLGSRVGRTSFPITIEKAGDLIRIPRCVNLNARVDATGLWDIAISSDLEELARIRVMVKRFGEDN
ncbi:hypothetical protein [Nocardia jiangxiensis]|uniref:hypothetical protein n=1 Tax=Nocardia jiangxiensis TaxID=282685 RepID=UPI0012F6388D|nr:hypothetical protein [Nocardia jiangxiensis]